MAKDARQRQKKLQRRKAKEKAKKKALALRNPRDPLARIAQAAAAPILHCCTSGVLWDQGMSNVLVSRELTSGNVAFVAFLLDIYCLGVKDVTYGVAPRSQYDWQVHGKLFRDHDVIELSPAAARKLIEGAVDYAHNVGLPPHNDYRNAKVIFGDIDASACQEEFIYGKDGKPFFIAGPHDSPERCRRITGTLMEHCGPDGFHFVMPLGSELLPPSF